MVAILDFALFTRSLLGGPDVDLTLYNITAPTKTQPDYGKLDVGNTCPISGST